MAKVVLCEDGIEVELSSQNGLWVVIRESAQGAELGRFTIDPTELTETLQGHLSFQATDGNGNSVTFEGGLDLVKVRLEGNGYAPKLCRIPANTVKTALAELSG